MYEPKYFNWSEFDSPDIEGSGRANMSVDFVKLLDSIRGEVGIPFKVTSGFRSASYNEDLRQRGYSASKTSAHLLGRAVDVACTDSRTRYKIVKAAISHGCRVGVAKSFVHIDNCSEADGKPVALWTY